MMPCSWVSEFVDFLRDHPQVDAGLHLTLTSEWKHYRWGPLVGQSAAPGLVDPQGCLWPTVAEVVAHATPDEVEAEIRAQIARARRMGFEPTHLDSHMGTLFAAPELVERYVRVGLETGIPVMLPGGHNTLLRRQLEREATARLRASGRWSETQAPPLLPQLEMAAEVGRQVWEGGLPVLDDLHNTSYDWVPEGDDPAAEETLRELKVARYSETLRELRPGVTMVIMHCTEPSEIFPFISASGDTRKGDLLAMLDPRLRQVIEEERIILTTFRELKARRDRLTDSGSELPHRLGPDRFRTRSLGEGVAHTEAEPDRGNGGRRPGADH
jgi:hypothetical protein